MSTTMKLIAKQTLGSDTASVTFSSITGTHTDIVVLISARTSDAAVNTNLRVRFNSATTNYSARDLYGTGSGAGSFSLSGETSLYLGELCGANATANTFGVAEVYIPNYAGSTNKSVSSTTCTENNATASRIDAVAGLWSSTSAITSMEFLPNTGNWKSGSSFFLYGVTNASGSIPGVFGVDATGGDVTISGGFKIHTFTSSGTFTVNQPGWVDYLVVAGGGGGGQGESNNFGGAGGGGGAGGMLDGSRLIQPGTYTVVVGGGGAGTATLSASGTNGADSFIGSLVVSAGGGFGAGDEQTPPGNGGSGGGRGGDKMGVGSGIAGQGFAGGASTGTRSGGGGGGAGEAGDTDGVRAGGDGRISSISGTATYYAGGGSGGSGDNTNSSTPGGDGGGGAGGYSGFSTGINGQANTGGGGGGKISNGSSGNGGSGIVIIRYPVT